MEAENKILIKAAVVILMVIMIILALFGLYKSFEKFDLDKHVCLEWGTYKGTHLTKEEIGEIEKKDNGYFIEYGKSMMRSECIDFIDKTICELNPNDEENCICDEEVGIHFEEYVVGEKRYKTNKFYSSINEFEFKQLKYKYLEITKETLEEGQWVGWYGDKNNEHCGYEIGEDGKITIVCGITEERARDTICIKSHLPNECEKGNSKYTWQAETNSSKVKTTKKFKEQLTTQEPFKGEVIETTERKGKNRLLTVKKDNDEITYIDESWIEYIQVNNCVKK